MNDHAMNDAQRGAMFDAWKAREAEAEAKEPAPPPHTPQAPTVTFTGCRRGRPLFDFGDFHVAPRWLIRMLDDRRAQVVDGRLLIDGREVAPGEVVSE